jgi:hypothetical protein
MRSRISGLAVTLACRACVNAAFAWWLWTRAPGWTDIFGAASVYVLIDGALALVMAFQLAVHPRARSSFLLSITVADAVLLIAAGIALRVFPGLSGFPVTIVLLYAAVGVWGASLGGLAVTVAVISVEHDIHADHARRLRDHALFDPLAGAGLIAVAFAVYAFVVGPPVDAPSLRRVAELGCALLAAMFLGGSIGALLRSD